MDAICGSEFVACGVYTYLSLLRDDFLLAPLDRRRVFVTVVESALAIFKCTIQTII